MNGARAIMQTISDLGAEAFFCLPGRGIYPLINEMVCFPEIRYVNALHEFALTAAADGYARAGRRAAFVSLYMSTGVMNASSALFMAHRDKIPMVVLGTQTESWAVGANARAESAGILQLVQPVTKWAWQPPTPDRVQEAIIRAYTIAMAPPQGPAFVALPVDFFSQEVEISPVFRPAAQVLTAGGEAIGAASEALASAENPVMVVGGEAVYAGAAADVLDFAETCNAVIVAEPDPSFIPVDTEHSRYGGELGSTAELIEAADVVIYAGVNSLEPPHAALLNSGLRKSHIYIGTDAARVNETVRMNHVLYGDIGGWLRGLGTAYTNARQRDPGLRSDRLLRIAADARSARRSDVDAVRDETPMSVSRVFDTLRSALPGESVVVEHATTAAQLFRQIFHVPDPSCYVASSGSNQGWGVGAVVGVKIARPDVPVVAVVGDGGFMFSCQSLQMSVAAGAPVIYVVLNNGGWASMRGSVARHAPNVARQAVDLGYRWAVDFVSLGQAMGANVISVHDPESLEQAIAEAVSANSTFVIDVHCAPLHPQFAA